MSSFLKQLVRLSSRRLSTASSNLSGNPSSNLSSNPSSNLSSNLSSSSNLSNLSPYAHHPLGKEEFVAIPAVQEAIKSYTKTLLNASSFGVPADWSDAETCFDKYHLPSLAQFGQLGVYHKPKSISKMSFMSIYLRCTLNDIPDILYHLYESDIMVVDGVQDRIPLVRLSMLHRIDTPSFRVRSDASIAHGGFYGFGYVVSDPRGGALFYKSSKANGFFQNLSHGECVTKSELMAISTALKNSVRFVKKHQDLKHVKIQLDSSPVVEILEGKIFPKSDDMMNVICRIGKYIKYFDDYSVSHLYRELNSDCDYLAKCGGADTNVTEEEFAEKYKNMPRFRHCVDPKQLQSVPKKKLPPRNPTKPSGVA